MLLALVLAAALPGTSLSAKADSAVSLSNPRLIGDGSLSAGEKVTWDCIYYGSYPQTEIVSDVSGCITYGMAYAQESDCIVDSALYSQLDTAEGWDDNNDLNLNGTMYRRVSKAEATCTTEYYELGNQYDWDTSASTYHYFRYEPIKWRVLHLDGSRAFLLADLSLDDQRYQKGHSDKNTWENSDVRSWLNGYDGSCNLNGNDYTNKNFVDTAFTLEEQKAIFDTELDNSLTRRNQVCDSNDTTDKIFLLAADDLNEFFDSDHNLINEKSILYGFGRDSLKLCKMSTYGISMGAKISDAGNCHWMIRSRGGLYSELAITSVSLDGSFTDFVYNYYHDYGIRPALNLDLSTASWSYAGTVCSDGTVVEDAADQTHTHSWDSIETIKPATCVSTGMIKHVCSGCEEYIPEITPIDPDNHDESIEEGVPAACTEPGTTDKITCTLCNKLIQDHEIIPALGHTEAIDIPEVAPTCTSNGYTKQSHCGVCGIRISTREPIVALGHHETAINEKPATLKVDGNTAGSYCSNCNEIYEQSEVIPRISKVSLSYTTATYSGSVKSPTVKVYDRTGKKLTENTDYVVSISTGRKNVGVYTYKLTFFGQYEGTAKLTLTINPKGTTISKLTALTKSFKVTWKKNSTQTSGYQLQYSTSSAFKSAKTVTVSGTSNTSKTIKSLKAKTKYYVRIRTYKKVSGKTYYSAWSTKKNVKTK